MSESKSIRGQQLKRLRALRIQGTGDVRPGVSKAVLRCIDDHGGQCWASVATIAAETQFSIRSVVRAITSLVDAGYLVESKRSGQTSVLSIDWTHPNLCQSDIGNPCQSGIPKQMTPMPESHEPMPESHRPMPESHEPMPVWHTNRKETVRNAKKRNSKSALRFDDEDLSLAKLMFERIKSVAPKTKTTADDLGKWANTIRMMRELDGNSLDEIKAVFNWANTDDFWKAQILSPDNLRKKFAALHARMVNPVTFGKPRTANVGAGVNYDSSRSLDWDR